VIVAKALPSVTVKTGAVNSSLPPSSSSRIVATPLALSRLAPTGALSTSEKVSLFSTSASLTTGTLTVASVWPCGMVSVPAVNA